MAYVITLTDGTTLATVNDGTVDTTSSSLTLIGKNYSGYGTFFNDNLVHLLENFSDSSAPATPLTGQLWWDTAGNLKVYNGSAFKTLAAITSSNSQPSGSVTGNMWWDTTNQQLYGYSGSNWILVGPATSANLGNTGVRFGNIIDTVAGAHVSGNVWIDDYIVAIISSDTEYTPNPTIPGFGNIKPGFNLVGTGNIAGVSYWGTAENSSKLGNVAAANYALLTSAAVFSDLVTSNIGFTTSTLTINVSGVNASITNSVTEGDLNFRINVAGTLTTVVGLDGTTGNVSLTSGNVNASGNMVVTNTLTASAATVSGNISSSNLNATANATVTNRLTTSNLTASTSSTLAGKVLFTGSESLTNGATANANVVTSFFSTTGTWESFLAAGTDGQIKIFMMVADGGNMEIQVTNPAWGGDGTLTFTAVGQACTLQYIANKWFVIGNNGVAIA